MKILRTEEIEELIKKRKKISMKELYDIFQVSENTIRRDLKEILKKDNYKKVYGGIIYVEEATLVPYMERNILNKKQKEKIGLKASNFVEDGDVIFIDSGTTTLEMIEGLKEKNITVFTNNLDFINRALSYKKIKIFSLPGILDRDVNSFVGKEAVLMLEKFNLNKCFIATTGISSDGDITNSSENESEIKQTAIKKSDKVFLLLDQSKLGKKGLINFSKLDKIDTVVIDKIDNKYKTLFSKYDIKIV